MRTVEVTRFVRAQPAAVERLLTPGTIVEYEGSFTVRDVEERDDDWLVSVGVASLGLTLRFERLADGEGTGGFFFETLRSGAGGDPRNRPFDGTHGGVAGSDDRSDRRMETTGRTPAGAKTSRCGRRVSEC